MGALQITIKDLLLIMKDRGAFSTLLALPMVIIAILGMSTGKLLTGDEENKLVRIGVVDECKCDDSAQVIQDLNGIGGLKVTQAENRQDASLQLEKGISTVTIILGKDFENRIDQLETSDVLDPEHGKLADGLEALDAHVETGGKVLGVGDLVEYVVMSAVLRSVAPEVLKHSSVLSSMMSRALERRSDDEKSSSQKRKAPSKPVSDEIYETLVPSFLVMFAFFLINIMSNSFITERDFGTLRRLCMSRISPWQILIGKTLPFLLVSIVQSFLMFLAGRFLFGMSLGTRPAMLLPVIFSTSISVTGLGLLLATIVRTPSQVSSYSTFLVVVLAGISGCYMPRVWLPQIMQTISLATPHAWALIAYQELLTRQAPNLTLVAGCCAALIAMGSVFFIIGAFRFRSAECAI